MQGNRIKLHDRQLETVNIKAAYNKHECIKKDSSIVLRTDLLTHRSNNSIDNSQIVFVTPTKIKIVNLKLPNHISNNKENLHQSWTNKRPNTQSTRFWRKHSSKTTKTNEKSPSITTTTTDDENTKTSKTEENKNIENSDFLERAKSPDSCDSTIITNILVESLNLEKDHLDDDVDLMKTTSSYNRKSYDKKIRKTDKEEITLSSIDDEQNDSSQKNNILISLPNRFQRTPSPETTQIIRVDVRTSNIPPLQIENDMKSKNSSPRQDKSKHRQKQSGNNNSRKRNFVNSKPCKLNVTCLKLELNLRNNAVT